MIRSVAKIDDVNNSQLDELSHLFSNSGDSREGDKVNKEKDPERFRYGRATKNRPTQGKVINPKATGKTPGGTEKPVRTGTGSSGGKSKQQFTVQRAVPLDAVRSILPVATDARLRKIFFTTEFDGDIELTVAAAGLSGNIELAVSSTSSGEIAKGRILATVRRGERFAWEIKLSEIFSGPIELTAISIASPTQKNGSQL